VIVHSDAGIAAGTLLVAVAAVSRSEAEGEQALE
jgi:hypothetical protein